MLTETHSQLALGGGPVGLNAALKSAGHKLTPARLAITRVLEAEGRHLTPAEVLSEARGYEPGVSRATVYRTLDLLTEMGLLRPIYVGERGSRVARVVGGHQHLVCLQCGAVKHLDGTTGEALEQALSKHIKDASYEVHSFLLELYWTCSDCRNRQMARG